MRNDVLPYWKKIENFLTHFIDLYGEILYLVKLITKDAGTLEHAETFDSG